MSLLRFVSRSLLASSFIVSGLNAVRNPEAGVPRTQPVTDKIVPLAKKYAPAEVASMIPTETTSLVRIGGFAQILGGVMLATGKGRRLGATILQGTMVPQLLGSSPLGESKNDEFLVNLSLFGGLAVAGRDTEGKPDLKWRAQAGQEHVGREARRAQKTLAKEAARAKKEAKKQARAAKKALSGN